MSEIRKIAIRAPKSLAEQAASLAMIKYLYDELDHPLIEIITITGKRHLYDYCQGIDRIHFIEEEKDTVLGVFPWIHNNSNLFAVNAFIDLHGGAAAATMGIALKASKRLAFSSTMTKPLLTHSLVKEQLNEFIDLQNLALAELLTEAKAPGRIRAEKAEVNEKEAVQLEALGQFIFVAIRASEWSRHQAIWQYWFDELKDISLVVVIDKDIESDDKSLEAVLEDRRGPDFLVIKNAHARTDLLFMNAAMGVITDSDLYGNIGPFYGLKTIILAFDLEDYPSFATYSPRPELFLERAETISKWINQAGTSAACDLETSVDTLMKILEI